MTCVPRQLEQVMRPSILFVLGISAIPAPLMAAVPGDSSAHHRSERPATAPVRTSTAPGIAPGAAAIGAAWLAVAARRLLGRRVRVLVGIPVGHERTGGSASAIGSLPLKATRRRDAKLRLALPPHSFPSPPPPTVIPDAAFPFFFRHPRARGRRPALFDLRASWARPGGSIPETHGFPLARE